MADARALIIKFVDRNLKHQETNQPKSRGHAKMFELPPLNNDSVDLTETAKSTKVE